MVLIITRALNQKLINDFYIISQSPIRLNQNSEPQPDILVLKAKQSFYMDASPRPEDALLVVEVADSSINFDKNIKLPLYAANEIQYVWLVDLKAKQLTCYAEPVNGQYSAQTAASDLSQVPLPFVTGISIDITPIFRFD